MDKVTIENPVYTSQEVEVDIRGQVKVITYNDELEVEYENSYICGSSPACSFVFSTGKGYRAEDIETWEFYDQNGNKIEVFDENGNPPQLKGMTRITFVVPDEEAGITEIHCYPIGPWSDSNIGGGDIIGGGDAGDGTDNGIFGGIWSFFYKLVDWFSNIFKQLVSLFGLGA